MATETTITTINIGDVERQIIAEYKDEYGLSQRGGTSAAIRQIIRDWKRMKSAQASGQKSQDQAA